MELERRRVLSQEKVKEDPTNSHEYIEIGGVKWATTNIGAEKETDYGLYFQWGDTAGYISDQCGSNSTAYKKPFSGGDYKFGNGTNSPSKTGMTKYNENDGKTVLEPSDDAATLYWGGDWRMPTADEFVALGAAVNTVWVTNYQGSGVAGLICTDKTDSSKVLFFPAAGYCYNGVVLFYGTRGSYWSSSLYTLGSARTLYAFRTLFLSSSANWNSSNYTRDYGLSVRPVLDT